jgi:two-component system, OmpR family, sensor histidine kinase CpxA
MLVSNLAGTRLQALGTVLRDELLSRPREEWDAILQRFTTAYRAQFLLFANDGDQLAGERLRLPEPVGQRLAEISRRPPRFEDGPLNDIDPDRPLMQRPRGLRPPPGELGDLDGPLPPRRTRLEELRDELRRPADAPNVRFVIHSDSPSAYWIGVPIARGPGGRRPEAPGTLLLVSKTLNVGGLVIDWSAWIWPIFGALLLSALFWLPLVRGITRSISQMQAATTRLAEGKFDVRVSESRRDELGSLGADINTMASRLDGFVAGQKRFLGDIAHELCSPIARMQMALGILEQRADEKQESYVRDVQEEIQHMSGLVNELLSFSKASLASVPIALQPVELRSCVEKAIRREQNEEVTIQNQVAPGLMAIADAELIARAVSNLLRNSVRYAGQAGPITVAARAAETAVELTISDCGPGVPESELSKLFDPFYRVDVSRARETGGVGLGLAIVKTCIESCGGTVSCRNLSPSGLEVQLRLKCAEQKLAG